MRRIHSSKRGFTLVEMMLALAIITIIGWTTVALMIAIKDSFMTTYNTNDSSDYALLYSNGFENSYLAHTQNKSKGKFGCTTNSILEQDTGVPVFTPRQMKTTNVTTGAEVDKWVVRMYFYVDPTDASQTVKYKVFVLDNYYSPTWKVMCVHEDSVWAPHLGVGKLTFSDYPSADAADTYIKAHYTLDGWHNFISYDGK